MLSSSKNKLHKPTTLFQYNLWQNWPNILVFIAATSKRNVVQPAWMLIKHSLNFAQIRPLRLVCLIIHQYRYVRICVDNKTSIPLSQFIKLRVSLPDFSRNMLLNVLRVILSDNFQKVSNLVNTEIVWPTETDASYFNLKEATYS